MTEPDRAARVARPPPESRRSASPVGSHRRAHVQSHSVRGRTRRCGPGRAARGRDARMTSNAPDGQPGAPVSDSRRARCATRTRRSDAGRRRQPRHVQPGPQRDRARQVRAQGQRQGRRDRRGLFAGAAFLVLLAIVMLSVALAYFISMTGLHLAWCFLIVFVVSYLLIAALLAWIGDQEGQAGPRARAGHPPGPGGQDHPRAALTEARTVAHPATSAAPSSSRARGRTGYVAANGARFHVVEARLRPPAATVAAAGRCCCTASRSSGGRGATSSRPSPRPGYRAVAMDLRGYGGSDKTPRGYDPVTLAQRRRRRRQGARRAAARCSSATAGAGTSAGRPPSCTPREVAGCAPWPRRTRAAMLPCAGDRAPGAAAPRATCSPCRLPLRPGAAAGDPRSGFLREHLRGLVRPRLGLPRRGGRADVPATRWHAWPAPHCALEYHRWLLRSRFRTDGRRFQRGDGRPVRLPVLRRRRRGRPGRAGGDPWPRPRGGVAEAHARARVPAPGHFPHEEAARRRSTGMLLAWLAEAAAGRPVRQAQSPVSTSRRWSRPARRSAATCSRGQRVAGVGVGHRGGEDHARAPRRRSETSGPPELPGRTRRAQREHLADHGAVAVDVGAAQPLLAADPGGLDVVGAVLGVAEHRGRVVAASAGRVEAQEGPADGPSTASTATSRSGS